MALQRERCLPSAVLGPVLLRAGARDDQLLSKVIDKSLLAVPEPRRVRVSPDWSVPPTLDPLLNSGRGNSMTIPRDRKQSGVRLSSHWRPNQRDVKLISNRRSMKTPSWRSCKGLRARRLNGAHRRSRQSHGQDGHRERARPRGRPSKMLPGALFPTTGSFRPRSLIRLPRPAPAALAVNRSSQQKIASAPPF